MWKWSKPLKSYAKTKFKKKERIREHVSLLMKNLKEEGEERKRELKDFMN